MYKAPENRRILRCFYFKIKDIKTRENILKVHSIETFGTHDGPGVRCVVFLQGCKLKCQYCHNPDTIAMDGGKAYSVEDLFQVILKAKPYFGKKGGVTISGGEPLLQAKALIPLFKKLKAEGIHTALDTNGRILNHFAMELMDELTDLVMLDIKHMTEEGYQEITGQKNKQTTFNLAEYREKSNKPMWLRYVLIPELTDKTELLESMGTYFRDYKSIERLELQPYHKLGVHKWQALGWKYPLDNARENTDDELATAVAVLKPYFKEVSVN